jgi:hypothetical protein
MLDPIGLSLGLEGLEVGLAMLVLYYLTFLLES